MTRRKKLTALIVGVTLIIIAAITALVVSFSAQHTYTVFDANKKNPEPMTVSKDDSNLKHLSQNTSHWNTLKQPVKK